MMRPAGNPRFGGLAIAGALCVALLAGLAGGCGEKIAIPEPSGVWANLAYSVDDTFDVDGLRQITTRWSSLYVLTSGELSKCNLELDADTTVTLSYDPTALCVDETGKLVLVWEQMLQRISFYDATTLQWRGATVLPEVESVSSMVTSVAGMDSTIIGGRTFLYLTDPVSGLVRRYAMMGSPGDDFTCVGCLEPAGALAWSAGGGARSVHQPGGLARDIEGRLLVCELDPERNWVIRFDSAPDSTDTTPIPPDQDPAMAGSAVVFGEPTCVPDPAAEDYVLGDAAACNEDGWSGGPSDAEGEFDAPCSLGVDGQGKIYVADYNNQRVQIFDALGDWQAAFHVRGTDARPIGLAVVDKKRSSGLTHYGAYVFVVADGSDRITKLISSEEYLAENGELPPYEE